MLLLLAAPALAELPPLTAEQKAQLEKKEAAEQAMLQHQKEALLQAQERVARQYRAAPPPKVEEKIGKGDVPKSATQPPGAPAKPHAGREMPQAEAHSQSAQ